VLIRIRRLLVRLIAVLSVSTAVTFVIAPPTHASVPTLQWPAAPLSGTGNASHLISHADGGVTVGCNNSNGTAVESFDSAGNVTQTIPVTEQPRLNACQGMSAVSKDGTLYSVAFRQDQGDSEVVVAYKGNLRIWSYTPPCGVAASVSSLAIGTNGNIYLLLNGNAGGTCSYNRLIGLEPTLHPGETAPRVTVDKLVYGHQVDSLAVYSSGLVLRYEDGIEYFDFSGNSLPLNPATGLPLAAFYHGHRFDTTRSGRAFVPIRVPVPACPNQTNSLGNNIVASIDAYDPGHRAFSYALPNCTEVLESRVTYNGGVVMSRSPNPEHLVSRF
jgi:hypothetical protein